MTDTAPGIDAIYEQYAAQPQLARVANGRPPVRGCGPLDSPLMVVGEAPGEQEERQGRPMVGPAGKLLQELFAKAELPWDCCYVTNVLPWRPPGNRTPYPFEIQASEHRLRDEVNLVDPVVVIAAGDVAWRCLTRGALGRAADAWFRYHDLGSRRFLAIPHPSYILRIGDRSERAVWESQTVNALSGVRQKAS